MTINFAKFILALVALIGMVVLIAAHSIDASAGLPIVTLIVGYSIGNGVNAKTGTATEGIINAKPSA